LWNALAYTDRNCDGNCHRISNCDDNCHSIPNGDTTARNSTYAYATASPDASASPVAQVAASLFEAQGCADYIGAVETRLTETRLQRRSI
jgi:hypothetical protein